MTKGWRYVLECQFKDGHTTTSTVVGDRKQVMDLFQNTEVDCQKATLTLWRGQNFVWRKVRVPMIQLDLPGGHVEAKNISVSINRVN